MKLRFNSNDCGYSLILFLILMALSVIVVTGALSLSTATARTTYNAKVRSTKYFTAEAGLNAAVSWLRDQSPNLLTPFKRDQFYTNFARTTPSAKANDIGLFTVPTEIKLNGTNNAAVLTNSTSLATAAFPATANIVTNTAYDAVGAFSQLTFGGVKVRITLVNALALDPAKDHGAPPNAAPTTDFYPVYRVDAVSQTDQGAHVYGYVTGSLFYVDTVGFYGRDLLDIRQDCKSYSFVNAASNPAALNAHCPGGSNTLIQFQNTAEIYGSARSNGGLANSDHHVCADFTNGCNNAGDTCSGAACGVPGLPTIQPWAVHCAGGNLGAVTLPDNTNLTLPAGVDPGQHCWTTVTINNKAKLTLTSTANPYWFQTLTIVGGNAATNLIISPSPASGTVRLYVDTVTGGNVNGNQALNPSGRPSQFRFYYLGAANLTLNGNANMGMAVVAPNAAVTIQGNADFNGGAIAKSLTLTGSANVIYDETLGGTSLNDANYKLKQVIEYYN